MCYECNSTIDANCFDFLPTFNMYKAVPCDVDGKGTETCYAIQFSGDTSRWWNRLQLICEISFRTEAAQDVPRVQEERDLRQVWRHRRLQDPHEGHHVQRVQRALLQRKRPPTAVDPHHNTPLDSCHNSQSLIKAFSNPTNFCLPFAGAAAGAWTASDVVAAQSIRCQSLVALHILKLKHCHHRWFFPHGREDEKQREQCDCICDVKRKIRRWNPKRWWRNCLLEFCDGIAKGCRAVHCLRLSAVASPPTPSWIFVFICFRDEMW